jgi:hypothetical protein
MRRATWIIAVLGFVAALIGGAIGWQVCLPCVGLVLGAAAGWFACQVQAPADQPSATRAGAIAGGTAGVVTLLGSVIGGPLRAILLGPEGAQEQMLAIAKSLGVTIPPTSLSPVTFYGTALAGSACCGAVVVFIMALLGALAGLVWFRQTRGDVPNPASV